MATTEATVRDGTSPDGSPSTNGQVGAEKGSVGTLFATTPEWGHRPVLDGLRAIAVYLVIAFHSGVEVLNGGFIGVDVFFVLSGFLMTNVLLSEIDATGRLRLGRFYARRMRRLAPAAIGVILATAAALILVVPSAERARLVDDARSSLLYLANWNSISTATDYFAAEDAPSPYLHFWSLSLEEQYYAFFPLVLLALVFVARRWSRLWLIPGGLAAMALASLAAQAYWNANDPIRAYYGTDARLYQILAGAVLGSVFLMRGTARHRSQVATGIAAVSLFGLFVFSTNELDLSPSVRGVVAAGLSTALIAGLELGRRSPLSTLLETPTFTYLGAVSYGTYLWHWPLIVMLRRVLDVDGWTMMLIAAPLATGMAALSYQVLETPIRRSPRLDPFPKTVALAGLAASVVAAVFLVAPILRSDQNPSLLRAAPLLAGAGELGSEPVPDDINYRALAGDRPPFPACDVGNLDQCEVVAGDGPHVLLIGDSHARMLIPAMTEAAETLDLRLTVNVTASCTWQYGIVNTLRPVPEQERCTEQRESWYQTALPELDPDVIVFASLARDGEGATPETQVPLDPALADLSLDELTAEVTERTLDLVAADGRTIVIVEPLPRADFNPLDCLSGAETVIECAFEAPEAPPSEALYRSFAASRDDVVTVDADTLSCPDSPICLPVIDGVVVRRDGSHLTSAYSASIGVDLWELALAEGIG